MKNIERVRALHLALAGLAAGALLVGCSAPAARDSHAARGANVASAKRAHPASGLQIIDLDVQSGKKTHRFRVELARTPGAQARGLMFRTELGDDEGMLFPSEPQAPRSFWMKNTPLALDIIFIGVDGRISNIAANAVPYSLKPILSQGSTSAVLELRGGRARALGIVPGNKVEYRLP